ncbi:AAA family ATPase [Shewanella glacialipiscicola]|uniref:AAA family ATPase n=1 Tax=Shewanella glacialipiscicola TaxID=614069 RepID=UPI003D79CF8A
MKINRVEIDNFMAIGQATLAFDSKGLVLIQGENKDDTSQNSNGAGKSTMVEALNWAIYNETARGDTGDSIVNEKAEKDCRVLVQIVDDAHTYNVIRHRKHKTHKNRLMLLDVTNPLDVIDLTSATDKSTQDRINKIIGCSSDVFRAAIYYGQEAQIDLPSLTDKHLKAIVEEAAGIDKMQEAHAIARAKHTAATRAVEVANGELSRAKFSLDNASEHGKELAIKQSSYDADTKANVEKLLSGATEYAKKAKSERALAASIPATDLEAELVTLSESIVSVKDENEHLSHLISASNEAKSKLANLERDFANKKLSAETLKGKLLKINDEIGTSCGSCGHVIAESDLAARTALLKSDFASKINEAKSVSEMIKLSRTSLDKSIASVDEYRASMTDISASVARQSEINNQLAIYRTHVKNAELAMSSAIAVKEQINKLKESANPFGSMIVDNQDEILNLSDAVDAAKKNLEAAQHLETIQSKVSDVFSPSGIRAHILDTVTPFLNDKTARYLGILSDGNISASWSTLSKTAKGEIRERFAIEVTSNTGGKSYRSLSGGEKRKVRLSTALALQDLVSSRAAKPIELWIGDEIDDAVDGAGLERLMTVLEEKAKEKGTVLIISHNELSDWCRQQATVVKENGMSTVDGVLNIDRDLGV